eukprot:1060762-Rhodomonas_salina.5
MLHDVIAKEQERANKEHVLIVSETDPLSTFRASNHTLLAGIDKDAERTLQVRLPSLPNIGRSCGGMLCPDMCRFGVVVQQHAQREIKEGTAAASDSSILMACRSV